jgi:GNAT superfamily N-acetyltransferase
MKSKHIPISVEEFELMEHPFGWKAEYFDGKAHLTPREYLVRTQMTLVTQSVFSSERVVPVDPSLQEQMIETFLEAFQDSVEFCNWSLDDIRTHARKNITNYFQGVRGKPHPVSRMVIEPNSDPLSAVGVSLPLGTADAPRWRSLSPRRTEGLLPGQTLRYRQRIIGLALFVENKQEQIELDLLLVKPSHQRTGIATQMVVSAINTLYAHGVRDLRSGYHICNDLSRAWHHSLGFEDIPEYFYCKLKSAWYRHEIWRWEKLGVTEQLEELRKEKDRWDRLVQELEMRETL